MHLEISIKLKHRKKILIDKLSDMISTCECFSLDNLNQANVLTKQALFSAGPSLLTGSMGASS